ncbi:MAG TPA: redoxin domain-containing protein [Acidimicrobiia bacterium]|nr:redoxin domain-containing protein [Acidimicrobiia bacterium]
MSLAIGTPAPSFALRNQRREVVSTDDLAGSPWVAVFIPFAFTGTCEGELCQIRDNFDVFGDRRVVVITCNTLHSNGVWAEQQGFQFDILSDFWPHGEVTRAYDTFDETYGAARRTTYFVDADGIITGVVSSDQLGVARPFEEYLSLLDAAV